MEVAATSALMAEAMAIWEGCALARRRNMLQIVVEFDSKLVISSLNAGLDCTPWEVLPILSRVLALESSFQVCSWSWISRSANAMADFVASHGVARMHNYVWVKRPSSSLVVILNNDDLPCPPSRRLF